MNDFAPTPAAGQAASWTTAGSMAEPRFPLAPLSTGQVLDRSLSLYRMTAWMSVGLMLIPALVSLVFGVVRVGYMHWAHLSPLTSAFSNPVLLTLLVIGSALAFAAFGCAGAGLVWGVSRVYLGHEATFQTAVEFALPHWFRYAALILVQLVQSAWVTLLLYFALFTSVFALRQRSAVSMGLVVGIVSVLALISLPYSIYRYIQVSLAMPAAVLEGLGIRDALRRSKALLLDRKGRIFLLFLLVGALYLVVGSLIGAVSIMSVRGTMDLIVAQAITLLSTFAATLLLQPLFGIALAVFYYDERVRREGFDIEFMMQEAARAAQPLSALETPTPAHGL